MCPTRWEPRERWHPHLERACPAQPTTSVPSSSGSPPDLMQILLQGSVGATRASRGGRIFLIMELEKQVLKESFKLKTGSSPDSVKAVCSHCHGASCSQHVTPILGGTPHPLFSPHLSIWTQGCFQLPSPGFLIGWFCFRC